MNTRPTLLCTVRQCGQELRREAGRVVCPQGHSFDVARSGHINLLQPQDRRSKNPGDSVSAVVARRAVHDAGATKPILLDLATLLTASAEDVVLDIGSGDGFYLGSLRAQFGFAAHGVDISHPAVKAASTRYPACEWIVCNADRFIPYADESFSRVMSLTARMNCSESYRVLRPGGKLVVGLPGPEDLIELRGSGKDRTERTIQTFEKRFRLTGHLQTTTTAYLDAETVRGVLVSIYRPMQREKAEAGLLTFSLDFLVFERR